MRKVSVFTVTMISVLIALAEVPRMSLRLSGNNHSNDFIWAATFKAIAENPGCCDEVWFSTGVGFPELSWHRENANRLLRYAEQLRKLKVKPSLQFQATLGHGDLPSIKDHCQGKHWRGFTGRKGVECISCNCPRQPAFLQYVKEAAKMYAELHPATMWIDDDLRIDNHRPAALWQEAETNYGCWCEDCIAAFNAKTGGKWTRESLDAAFDSDEALRESWKQFNVEAVCEVARVIGREFVCISPETTLGIQHATREYVSSIIAALHEVSGKSVGVRPGGGAYYELDVRSQIYKSMNCVKAIHEWNKPACVSIWTPEVETWPRAYASRSAQSIIIEAFAALAYGMNSASFYVMDSKVEAMPLYSKKFLKPLADASSVLKEYARQSDFLEPVGVGVGSIKLDDAYRFALSGVPVTFNGNSELTEEEVAFPYYFNGTKKIQEFRDKFDEKISLMPAKLIGPFVGLMIPKVNKKGELKTIALINTLIDAQEEVVIRLKKCPASKKVCWHELRREVKELTLEMDGDGAKVVIPSIGAWNGGFLSFE